MGNCCSTCRLRRGKWNRNSSAKKSDVGAIAPGEYRPHGRPYTVNTKRPSWAKEQCSPFDLANLWPSREDLNREATRNRFTLRHRGMEQCEMGSKVINGGERTALRSPSPEDVGPEDVGPVKVAGWRSSNSGGISIPRLRKKDSTRKPRYKDEIMLVDNIDKIVEEEIPDEDHLNGACARTLAAGVPRDDGCAVEFTSDGCEELQEAGEHIVKQVEGDVEADDLVCAPLDFKSVTVPNDIRSNFDEIDEEDLRVAQEIRTMLKQVVSTGGVSQDSVPKIPELVQLPKMVSSTWSPNSEFDEDGSAKLYSPDSSTSSIGESQTPEIDEQLTKDIEYILDDDIGPDDRNDETSVSEWKQPGGDAVSSSLEGDLRGSAHGTLDNSIIVEESDKASSRSVSKKPETVSVVEFSNDTSESSVISLNQEVLASEREFTLLRDVCLAETRSVSRTPFEVENGVEFVALPEAMPVKRNFASRPEKKDERVMEENGKVKNSVTTLQFHVEDDSVPSRNDGLFSRKSTCLTDQRAQQRGTATSHPRLYGEKGFCDVDFVSMLKDELPSAKLNWYGTVSRPRTRNPRRDFDLTAGKCANTVPRIRQKYGEMARQSAGQRQNVEEIKINRPESQSVGPGARPKSTNGKKPTSREEMEMKNAFNRISEEGSSLKFSLAIRAPSGRLCGSRKGSELNIRKPSDFNAFSSRELNRSDANWSFDLGGRKSESPFSRASDSSINKLRPMAARTSKLATSHSPDVILQHPMVPRPPTTAKGTNRRPIIFVRPAPNTRLIGMAARRDDADQGDCCQSGDSEQNCFKKELKRSNGTGVPSMACSKTAVRTDWRQNVACSQPSPKSLYGKGKHKLTRELEKAYDGRKSRMSDVNSVGNADERGHRSQRCSFGPSCESEDQGSVARVKKSQTKTGKESLKPRSASRLTPYRGTSDKKGHAKTWAPELVYNKEELELMAEIEGQWA